jgi:hypothetical protein
MEESTTHAATAVVTAAMTIEMVATAAASERGKANQAGGTNEKSKHSDVFLSSVVPARLGESESDHAASTPNVSLECEARTAPYVKKC